MVNNLFIKSLIIGVLVMLSLYIAFSKAFDLDNYSNRKILGLFSGGVGLLTFFWLLENTILLEKYTTEIVIGGIGSVLALLGLTKKKLE
jgi:hypothetical protein